MHSDTRLLAVSDSFSSRSFLCDGFSEGAGFSVQVLSSEADAAEHLRQHEIDLLLFDAGGDFDRCEQILVALRAEWPRDTLPIIVMTDVADYDVLERLLEAGASDFVLKPLQREDLSARLHAALIRQERIGQLLENERQRVLTEALARASASTAVAMESMIDDLEVAMSASDMPADKMQACLFDMLQRTEVAVATIDRIRRIATLKEVPYATRAHLLEKLPQLN